DGELLRPLSWAYCARRPSQLRIAQRRGDRVHPWRHEGSDVRAESARSLANPTLKPQRMAMINRFAFTFPLALVPFIFLLHPAPMGAQSPARPVADDPLEHLQWRELGPAVMGGRIDDFAVLEKNPDVIYVATASGGMWRTTDGAITWKPIFEHVGPMSIGAVAVSQSAPSIVWAGTGEPNNRNTSSWGAGVFKSIDGG